VLNALERYYASQNRYPWNAINSSLTVDQAYGVRSNEAGFGICSVTSNDSNDSHIACDGNKMGALIDTDELKGSFANKSYFEIGAEVPFDSKMYLYKFPSDGTYPNAIYVCYVPKAKVNRTSANRLWRITQDSNNNNEPSGLTEPVTTGNNPDFDTNGNASVTFADVGTSLFKCMPE